MNLFLIWRLFIFTSKNKDQVVNLASHISQNLYFFSFTLRFFQFIIIFVLLSILHFVTFFYKYHLQSFSMFIFINHYPSSCFSFFFFIYYYLVLILLYFEVTLHSIKYELMHFNFFLRSFCHSYIISIMDQALVISI